MKLFNYSRFSNLCSKFEASTLGKNRIVLFKLLFYSNPLLLLTKISVQSLNNIIAVADLRVANLNRFEQKYRNPNCMGQQRAL